MGQIGGLANESWSRKVIDNKSRDHNLRSFNQSENPEKLEEHSRTGIQNRYVGMALQGVVEDDLRRFWTSKKRTRVEYSEDEDDQDQKRSRLKVMTSIVVDYDDHGEAWGVVNHSDCNGSVDCVPPQSGTRDRLVKPGGEKDELTKYLGGSKHKKGPVQ